MWQKMSEIICDDKDREYLKKLEKNTKILLEIYGTLLIEIMKKLSDVNCKQTLYYTNWRCFSLSLCSHKNRYIFEQSLKEIVDYLA